ncbi:bacillithiol biosynthesis cysteine-adding enzyme BshC [Paenibacillus koleovorans]|uniref:bacillithiol biosynthesis cysteine-adding enzyme BshC n=1 Tax=Paenibacillus koleovorans TaxID=121608 RepID=UPI000FD7BCFD|nr:bacillithiol biosynthesis cysteine-adding enzyme BshC [Paenibacillus koleovorans]
MRIEEYRWLSNQPLTRTYMEHYSAVGDLYAYDPMAETSLIERAAWLDASSGSRPAADRGALCDVLAAYNREIGNSAEAMAAIEVLRDPRTLVVVGGQQAGLFGGPLLVLYKAVTAILSARSAEAALGRPVVPVFWIAGEDHDWDEVNHIQVLTDSFAVHKIKLGTAPEKKGPVSGVSVSAEEWEAALQQLDESLMNTEFKGPLMEQVRELCLSSGSLSDGFAKLMARLFGNYGLILIDSADPAVRRLEGPMFSLLAERERELSGVLLGGQERLRGLGYEPQAEVRAEQANLFIVHEGERLLLSVSADGGYTDKRGALRLTGEELAAIARDKPELLSNNVMTRPLMQDYLFPVLSVVLGGSEIAYWGLLKDAFAFFGMQMPVLLPRMEFTLVEGTLQKQMKKYELDFEAVIREFDRRKQAWLDAQGSLQLAGKFADVKEKFADLYKPVVDAVGELNPGMRKLAETNMQKLLEQIEFLETRAGEAFESQFETALRHWERLRVSLLPLGKPQERVFNAFAYLVKYGDGWLKELLSTPMQPDGRHRIVYF